MRLVSENTKEDANGFGEDAGVHGNYLRTRSAFTAIARCFRDAGLTWLMVALLKKAEQ
jgi:hypothetical protein